MCKQVVRSKFLHLIDTDPYNYIAYHSLYGNPIKIDSQVKQLLNQLKTPQKLECFLKAEKAIRILLPIEGLDDYRKKVMS